MPPLFQIPLGYLDPNVGGWLFQLLFPVVVAISGAWLVLRRRIRGLWVRIFGDRKKEKPDK